MADILNFGRHFEFLFHQKGYFCQYLTTMNEKLMPVSAFEVFSLYQAQLLMSLDFRNIVYTTDLIEPKVHIIFLLLFVSYQDRMA